MHQRNRQKPPVLQKASTATRRRLHRIFDALYRAYGPRHWWPGDSPTEIAIGAVLTQNTNWNNVEKSIAALKERCLLNWQRLHEIDVASLAGVIRPSGYHNVKAVRLKNLAAWVCQNGGGRIEGFEHVPTESLRESLLTVNGVGPETADAILLYAMHRPTFVVDTYTGRLARRHGLISDPFDYAALKALFQNHLTADVAMFNEFHALIVEVGKRHCGPQPRCDGCPLSGFAHEIATPKPKSKGTPVALTIRELQSQTCAARRDKE